MKKLFENFWFGLFLGLALLQLATYSGQALLKRNETQALKDQMQALQQENEQLKQTQNLVVWTMDKSCFDQLNNSVNSIMTLKLSKGGEK